MNAPLVLCSIQTLKLRHYGRYHIRVGVLALHGNYLDI